MPPALCDAGPGVWWSDVSPLGGSPQQAPKREMPEPRTLRASASAFVSPGPPRRREGSVGGARERRARGGGQRGASGVVRLYRGALACGVGGVAA